VKLTKPNLSPQNAEQAAENFFLPFQKLPVFHKIKFWNSDTEGLTGILEVHDSIHARPLHKDKWGKEVPGRFDTALVKDCADADGVLGAELSFIPFILLPKYTDIARLSCCSSTGCLLSAPCCTHCRPSAP